MMNKLVLLSDPHLDLEVPKARLDADYIGTQTNKFRFVLSETVKRKALLCIAGDLCNSQGLGSFFHTSLSYWWSKCQLLLGVCLDSMILICTQSQPE